MENINVSIGEGAFDRLVHGTPDDQSIPQVGESIAIAGKPGCTAAGRAGIVISFQCLLPDGTEQRVQAVTSRAIFLAAAAAIEHAPLLQDPA